MAFANAADFARLAAPDCPAVDRLRQFETAEVPLAVADDRDLSCWHTEDAEDYGVTGFVDRRMALALVGGSAGHPVFPFNSKGRVPRMGQGGACSLSKTPSKGLAGIPAMGPADESGAA